MVYTQLSIHYFISKKVIDFKVAKNISRLAAVQLMYTKNILNTNITFAYDYFKNYMEEESLYNNMHHRFFKKLISYFLNDVKFSEIYSQYLSNSKMLENSDIFNSIVKVAILEMIYERTAMPVIINEYVEISKNFLSDKDVKLINAILDKISKHIEKQCLNQN